MSGGLHARKIQGKGEEGDTGSRKCNFHLLIEKPKPSSPHKESVCVCVRPLRPAALLEELSGNDPPSSPLQLIGKKRKKRKKKEAESSHYITVMQPPDPHTHRHTHRFSMTLVCCTSSPTYTSSQITLL